MVNYYTNLLIRFHQFNQGRFTGHQNLIKQKKPLQNKHFTLTLKLNFFDFKKQRKIIYKQLIYFQGHVYEHNKTTWKKVLACKENQLEFHFQIRQIILLKLRTTICNEKLVHFSKSSFL